MEFLVPDFWFRVYSLRFRNVSWSHRVHKSTARRGIYAQVRTNDAMAHECDAELREINAQRREGARNKKAHQW